MSGTTSLTKLEQLSNRRRDLQRPDGWAHARAIAMHELGHLVGLAQVNVNTELMYPENIAQRTFGPGDREGLRQLGLGRCFTS